MVNNNLGVLSNATINTAGSVDVPVGATNYDIVNWVSIDAGTYIMSARALGQEGTEFGVHSINSLGSTVNEIVATKRYCDICIPITFNAATILAFRVVSTTNPYTIWNDQKYYSFKLLRIK